MILPEQVMVEDHDGWGLFVLTDGWGIGLPRQGDANACKHT